MPAQYDVVDNALLNGRALAWSSEVFELNQLLAEAVLGLPVTAYSDPSDLEQIELAVVLQLNFQAEQGIDPYIYKELWLLPQKQRKVYADRYADPRALLLASIVDGRNNNDAIADRWASMTSYRLNE